MFLLRIDDLCFYKQMFCITKQTVYSVFHNLTTINYYIAQRNEFFLILCQECSSVDTKTPP